LRVHKTAPGGLCRAGCRPLWTRLPGVQHATVWFICLRRPNISIAWIIHCGKICLLWSTWGHERPTNTFVQSIQNTTATVQQAVWLTSHWNVSVHSKDSSIARVHRNRFRKHAVMIEVVRGTALCCMSIAHDTIQSSEFPRVCSSRLEQTSVTPSNWHYSWTIRTRAEDLSVCVHLMVAGASVNTCLSGVDKWTYWLFAQSHRHHMYVTYTCFSQYLESHRHRMYVTYACFSQYLESHRHRAYVTCACFSQYLESHRHRMYVTCACFSQYLESHRHRMYVTRACFSQYLEVSDSELHV